jgi:hypothetical protein
VGFGASPPGVDRLAVATQNLHAVCVTSGRQGRPPHGWTYSRAEQSVPHLLDNHGPPVLRVVQRRRVDRGQLLLERRDRRARRDRIQAVHPLPGAGEQRQRAGEGRHRGVDATGHGVAWRHRPALPDGARHVLTRRALHRDRSHPVRTDTDCPPRPFSAVSSASVPASRRKVAASVNRPPSGGASGRSAVKKNGGSAGSPAQVSVAFAASGRSYVRGREW